MELSSTLEKDLKEDFPSEQEKRKRQAEAIRKIQTKFLEKMVDLVEDSVVENKKVVVIPITKRLAIADVRHLIKRIAVKFGYQVKNMKKRHIIVENTKFIFKMKKQEVPKKNVVWKKNDGSVVKINKEESNIK